MRIFLAILVGFLIAFALFMLSPLIQELTARARRRLYVRYPRLLARALQATMVQPVNVNARQTMLAGADVVALTQEHNKVVDVLRILCAKLDLDAGVTDVNYAALVTAATGVSPAKIDLF